LRAIPKSLVEIASLTHSVRHARNDNWIIRSLRHALLCVRNQK